MTTALESEAQRALQSSGAEWAHLSVSGRSLSLNGTTASANDRDRALASLLAVPGVAAVDAAVTVAPRAAPYRIAVAVENGAIRLSGSVPNEAIRQALIARPELATVDLLIRSGQPDEALWLDGVEFALAQARHVETGRFELSDMTLHASGRASSERALGRLDAALAALPAEIAPGAIDIQPASVSPYIWRAEYDGQRIAISGYVPEATMVERLRMADVAGLPVSTGLSLASGAPTGFAAQAKLLVEQLARLESGEASIADGVSRLTGVPPSMAVAQAVTETLSGPNSIVELAPPRVPDYWISINRQPGNVLVFDGYVPDEATRARFADIEGADVSFLKFGAGAPESYPRAVDFGLELLAHLSEGRFSLAGDSLSATGLASSSADYRAARALLEDRLPQGLSLGQVAVQAPRAEAYEFAVRRTARGDIVLSGMLPSPEIEFQLVTMAGARARSEATFASGEAPDFVASAEQAMQFLPWLRQGEIRFDGAAWSVEGEPGSLIDKGSIEAEFAVRGLAQVGWSLDLSQPPATPALTDPFTWSAERLADGSFLFAGNVPAKSLQDYLDVHVGARVTDTSKIALGAPDGFAMQARAAVDALLALEQGRANFDGKTWTLAGAAASAEARSTSLQLAQVLHLSEEAAISAPETVPNPPYQWSAAKTADGRVVFRGAVPAESLQRFLAVRGGDAVADETSVRAGAPLGFAGDVLKATELLALLTEGQVAFDGTEWAAKGTGSAPDILASAETILGEALPHWSLKLAAPDVQPIAQEAGEQAGEQAVPATATTDTNAPIAPEPSAASVPGTDESAADLALCQARLAELSSHNAILFQSGAAIITAGAAGELDAFAQALALCPAATIDVEGHTDSDGDAQLNLALSVARAEAVANALIERGIAPERLYAIGYGESRPIADNATTEGKRQNRRIVVSVRAAGEAS